MTDGIRNYRASEPRLRDFWNDMNKHGGAEYRREVGSPDGPPTAVVEAEDSPGEAVRVTVWSAVLDPQAGRRYAAPNVRSNRYAWDAVGRANVDAATAAEALASVPTGRESLADWCGRHPYDGPRSPHRVESDGTAVRDHSA